MRCRMHGGTNLGAPKGNKNAFKHGRYSAEAMAFQKNLRLILKSANDKQPVG